MKKLAMLLGCGMVAFAIGCGDGGGSGGGGGGAAPVTPPVGMMPDATKMKETMDKGGPGGAKPPAGDAAGEKKDDAAAEKKEDAPAEKKEDAAAEKKE